MVVGCAVFRAPVENHEHPGESRPVDLWRALHPTVVRARAKSDQTRIPIDDSKKLKLANTSPRPLMHLERGVLPALGLLNREPATDGELLDALGAGGSFDGDDSQQGAASTALTPEQITILTNTFRLAMRAAGVDLLGLTCQAIDANSYNRALTELGAKPEVSFRAVGRLIRGVWRRWGTESPLVAVDRQGGRKHYGGHLCRAIPGVVVTTRVEEDALSVYEIEPVGGDGSRRMTVRFDVKGDDHHLPVALASMAAKLVRERLMLRFNNHWAGRAPAIRPTAGYGADARRWINEIRPLIGEDELRTLVRRA